MVLNYWRVMAMFVKPAATDWKLLIGMNSPGLSRKVHALSATIGLIRNGCDRTVPCSTEARSYVDCLRPIGGANQWSWVPLQIWNESTMRVKKFIPYTPAVTEINLPRLCSFPAELDISAAPLRSTASSPWRRPPPPFRRFAYRAQHPPCSKSSSRHVSLPPPSRQPRGSRCS